MSEPLHDLQPIEDDGYIVLITTEGADYICLDVVSARCSTMQRLLLSTQEWHALVKKANALLAKGIVCDVPF